MKEGFAAQVMAEVPDEWVFPLSASGDSFGMRRGDEGWRYGLNNGEVRWAQTAGLAWLLTPWRSYWTAVRLVRLAPPRSRPPTTQPRRRRRFSPQFLGAVAAVYRANPGRPAAAVADAFMSAQFHPALDREQRAVSLRPDAIRARAHRAITAAREDGLLGPSRGPRRKGELA